MEREHEDNWQQLSDVIRLTYENMAARWNREDMEQLARREGPVSYRGVAGAMRDRTGGETNRLAIAGDPLEADQLENLRAGRLPALDDVADELRADIMGAGEVDLTSS